MASSLAPYTALNRNVSSWLLHCWPGHNLLIQVNDNINIWRGGAPNCEVRGSDNNHSLPRSTQPSTLHGTSKWVTAFRLPNNKMVMVTAAKSLGFISGSEIIGFNKLCLHCFDSSWLGYKKNSG